LLRIFGIASAAGATALLLFRWGLRLSLSDPEAANHGRAGPVEAREWLQSPSAVRLSLEIPRADAPRAEATPDQLVA
jgi:hypothetical protein